LADGRQELVLSNGERLLVDLCIPAHGIIPNSSYIPDEFLNAGGFVHVDQYFKLKNSQNIYAIGDLSDCEAPQYWYAEKQAAHLARNIILTLTGRTPIAYKSETGSGG
jgi:NADH dehydrogenase FAD-containing subunit